MIYRRVVNNELDGTFYASGGFLKIGAEAVPLDQLSAKNIYPQIEPDYDPSEQVVSDLYFDGQTVTREVHNFEIGIANNWKSTNFVDGELYRPYRVRVLFADTLTGAVLDAKASDMGKSGAPIFRVDEDGTLNPIGLFSEIYLNYIEPADLALINAYVSATEGAIYQNYNDL